MSRNQFKNEINNTLSRFQKKTPILFTRTLIAFSSTNWNFMIAEKYQGQNTTFLGVPFIYNSTKENTTCSCVTSRLCTVPAQVFDDSDTPQFTVEGFVFSCYMLETVLRTSLSCLFSSSCIHEFRQKYVAIMSSRNHNQSVNVKFDSEITRFNINDTIETLAAEIFIESWVSDVSYEKYFTIFSTSFHWNNSKNSKPASYCINNIMIEYFLTATTT